MTRMLALVGAVLSGLALAACGSSPSPPTGTVEDRFAAAIAASRADPAAPAAVRDGGSRTRCEDVILDQGETVPAVAVDCLADAATGGAELAIAAPTTEGDPLVTFVIVSPDGIRTFTDTSHDRFGQPGWTEAECDDLGSAMTLGACG